jgi:hypothetical protein
VQVGCSANAESESTPVQSGQRERDRERKESGHVAGAGAVTTAKSPESYALPRGERDRETVRETVRQSGPMKLQQGKLRARTAEGWVSLVASDGTVLLVACDSKSDLDEQRDMEELGEWL